LKEADRDEPIAIRGARVHNLKGLDCDIPRNRLVVITGPSGSGKSSLAFDTLYAEGQRRYVESLSPWARQFLEQMDRPEVESVTGLSPAIAIEQRTTVAHPRSTVGTVTEIYDHLRVLFATLGRPHCPRCSEPIAAQRADEMAARLVEQAPGAVAVIAAPVARGRKGAYRKELQAASTAARRTSATGSSSTRAAGTASTCWSTAWCYAPTPVSACGRASRRRCSSRAVWCWCRSRAAASGCCRSTSPARAATCRCRSRARARSPSTALTARAPRATGSASAGWSTPRA
jgi:hypothetical protein